MTSKVEICNVALTTWLGAETINSLTEGTPAAVQCNLHYDRCLRGLLEWHWWEFAKERQVLAELTNDRDTVWDYKYQRPADALAIRWVNDAATARDMIAMGRSPDTPRAITQTAIYSDVQTATCEYTALKDDPSIYSQLFRDALSARIAASIARPITENAAIARDAAQAARQLAEEAAMHDDSESEATDYAETASWLQVRGIS